jgi:hypothetical protein
LSSKLHSIRKWAEIRLPDDSDRNVTSELMQLIEVLVIAYFKIKQTQTYILTSQSSTLYTEHTEIQLPTNSDRKCSIRIDAPQIQFGTKPSLGENSVNFNYWLAYQML